jgi:hypothetical protein
MNYLKESGYPRVEPLGPPFNTESYHRASQYGGRLAFQAEQFKGSAGVSEASEVVDQAGPSVEATTVEDGQSYPKAA